MIFKGEAVLGIDISSRRIDLALVKHGKNGPRVTKIASGEMPAGVLVDGNIEDPLLLAKAIKRLRDRNRMTAGRASMNLVASPMLIQVVDLPDGPPNDLYNFVQDKVRQCAMIPTKNVAMDFCGVRTKSGAATGRALLVAADNQRIAETVGAMNRIDIGLNVDRVEPAPLGVIRACYADRIATRPNVNLLLVVVHGGFLTFCLFTDKSLDFVRTKRPGPEGCGSCGLDSQQCLGCVGREINAVIQYYELEVPDNRADWQVVVVADVTDEGGRAAAEQLQEQLDGRRVGVVSFAEACPEESTAAASNAEVVSPAAVGLAMGLLEGDVCGLGVNLLPSEVREVKAARRQSWLIANAAEITIVLMILGVGFMQMRVKNLYREMQQGTSHLDLRLRGLTQRSVLLQKQIEDLSNGLQSVESVLGISSLIKWGEVVSELQFVTPKMVRITRLSSDNVNIMLEAQAFSYDAIRLFVEKLGGSKYIKTAALIGSQKRIAEGLVQYSVKCALEQNVRS